MFQRLWSDSRPGTNTPPSNAASANLSCLANQLRAVEAAEAMPSFGYVRKDDQLAARVQQLEARMEWQTQVFKHLEDHGGLTPAGKSALAGLRLTVVEVESPRNTAPRQTKKGKGKAASAKSDGPHGASNAVARQSNSKSVSKSNNNFPRGFTSARPKEWESSESDDAPSSPESDPGYNSQVTSPQKSAAPAPVSQLRDRASVDADRLEYLLRELASSPTSPTSPTTKSKSVAVNDSATAARPAPARRTQAAAAMAAAAVQADAATAVVTRSGANPRSTPAAAQQRTARTSSTPSSRAAAATAPAPVARPMRAADRHKGLYKGPSPPQSQHKGLYKAKPEPTRKAIVQPSPPQSQYKGLYKAKPEPTRKVIVPPRSEAKRRPAPTPEPGPTSAQTKRARGLVTKAQTQPAAPPSTPRKKKASPGYILSNINTPAQSPRRQPEKQKSATSHAKSKWPLDGRIRTASTSTADCPEEGHGYVDLARISDMYDMKVELSSNRKSRRPTHQSSPRSSNAPGSSRWATPENPHEVIPTASVWI